MLSAPFAWRRYESKRLWSGLLGGQLLGACWVPLPRHAATIDEIVEVRWSDYYGAALFGDADQIACLPRKGCPLEIVATAESSHHGVNLLLPGHVLHYTGAFCFLDRFKLPNGTTVGLWHLVGFKLRLVSDTIAPMSREDAILYRVRAGSERKTRRWAASPCKLVQRVDIRQSMHTRHGRLAAVFEEVTIAGLIPFGSATSSTRIAADQG